MKKTPLKKLKKVKKLQQEVKEWHQKLGTTKEKAGTCVVCYNDVMRKVIKSKDRKKPGKILTRYEPGFFCGTCGLRYEFPPPAYVLDKPRNLLDELVVNDRESTPSFL